MTTQNAASPLSVAQVIARIEKGKQERPDSFLQHARICTSQYDAQYRSMADEILALRAALVDAEEAKERLTRDHLPHMCRDGHTEIRHRDSENEMCPLCMERARAERAEAALAKAEYDARCATQTLTGLKDDYYAKWRRADTDAREADARIGVLESKLYKADAALAEARQDNSSLEQTIRLMREALAAARAREARVREAAQAVIAAEPKPFASNEFGLWCHFCEGEGTSDEASFEHDEDCPWVGLEAALTPQETP